MKFKVGIEAHGPVDFATETLKFEVRCRGTTKTKASPHVALQINLQIKPPVNTPKSLQRSSQTGLNQETQSFCRKFRSFHNNVHPKLCYINISVHVHITYNQNILRPEM